MQGSLFLVEEGLLSILETFVEGLFYITEMSLLLKTLISFGQISTSMQIKQLVSVQL